MFRDLVTEERIALAEIATAIDTYLADPTTQDHPLGADHSAGLDEAVARHAPAHRTLADTEAAEIPWCIPVRSAQLMAKPSLASTLC